MTSHFLIVDDDVRLRDLLRRYLLKEGFWVSTTANVTEARLALQYFSFDALIVDIMMPGGCGTDLLTLSPLPPVLLLSAMGESADRIHGLELGAEDYLVKPFEPRELVLRLQTIIKRYGRKDQLSLGPNTYSHQKLYRHGQEIILTPTERGLLEYFAQRINCIVARQEILDALFPAASNSRIIDVHINRLRRKLDDHLENPQLLVSVRGQGYCLKET